MLKHRLVIGLLLLCLILSFSSCSVESFSALLPKNGKVEKEGVVRLVLAADEKAPEVYEVDLSKLEGECGLFSVLEALAIPYVENDGFLTEVGRVKQDPQNGVYLALWTTAEADKDPSGWIENRTFDGLTLYPSLVGGADMTLTDGVVLYVGTIVYTW